MTTNPRRNTTGWAVLGVLVAVSTGGCGGCGKQDKDEAADAGPCTAGSTCADGTLCEQVVDAGTACFLPLVVEGVVVDGPDGGAVVAAEVLALSEDGTPRAGPVQSTDAGTFLLPLRVARRADGSVPPTRVSLRAAAQDHEEFPGQLRRALPLQLDQAVRRQDQLVYSGDLTRLELPRLPPDATRGELHGQVTGDPGTTGGVLVTAAAGETPAALTGLTDETGVFSIFNVPPATYTVRGYAAGLQLAPAAGVVVAAGQRVTGVTLATLGLPTGTVSGSVNPVAGGCAAGTSVVLVPRETLSPATVFPLTAVSVIRAQVPRGLRTPPAPAAPNISGAFSIPGVPDGTYEVLAAYENDPDPCVLDPSNIGGALFIRELTLPEGGSRTLSVEAFKVTGAVPLLGPGAGDAPEAVDSPAPTFRWSAVSSAKNYQVGVYDAAGRQVWATTLCANADNGCGLTDPPSLHYGLAGQGSTLPVSAPALESGRIYQWRVVALGSRNGARCGLPGIELDNDRECISVSEDMRGLFRTP